MFKVSCKAVGHVDGCNSKLCFYSLFLENASPSHEDSAYAAKYGSDSFQKNNKRLKVTYHYTGLDKQNFSIKKFTYFLTYNLGAQKNRLIEMVLLSTHNICFG